MQGMAVQQGCNERMCSSPPPQASAGFPALGFQQMMVPSGMQLTQPTQGQVCMDTYSMQGQAPQGVAMTPGMAMSGGMCSGPFVQQALTGVLVGVPVATAPSWDSPQMGTSMVGSWQAIALPVGVAPPEGAIPITSPEELAQAQAACASGGGSSSMSTMSTSASDGGSSGNTEGNVAYDGTWYPPNQDQRSPTQAEEALQGVPQKRPSKAFKIMNPKTKREVKAGSKAFLIMDPTTGEAVTPDSGKPVPAG